MMSAEEVSAKEVHSERKRKYAKPQIQIFGDLREITQIVGKAGDGDGGTGTGQKTAL
jgi:hypothetical protein